MKRFLEFLVRRCGDLALGLLCVAAVATFAGKLFWVFDLASHFQVYYFCAALLLLVGNVILKRRKPRLIALVLVGIGIFHLFPYFVPTGSKEVKPGKDYTVMLLNLNYGNQKTAAVKKAIAEAQPDFLVLQEVTPRWRQELAGLEAEFKSSFDFPEDGAFGIWVMSEFQSGDIDVQERGGIRFLHLRYSVEGKPLELVALHPVPPVGGANSAARNALLEDAAVYASGASHRMAVGDLNCSPWSPYFRSFLKKTGLRDSAAGRGVQGTWFPLPMFGIPIDHVLVSPDIVVVDRQVGGDVGSDHRPVIVKFRFITKGS